MLNEIGVSANVIPVSMCIENRRQMQPLILQQLEQKPPRTGSDPRINQERLLPIANDQPDVAGSGHEVYVIDKFLQVQVRLLSVQDEHSRDYSGGDVKRQGFCANGGLQALRDPGSA